MKYAARYITVLLLISLSFGIIGCASGQSDDPVGNNVDIDSLIKHQTSVTNPPRVIIAQKTYEKDGQIMPYGKTFIPYEFENDPKLQEIKNYLPVITFYPFDMSTLQGDGWNLEYFEELIEPTHSVVFIETPESVLYTVFDEKLNILSTSEKFEFPTEIGDHILRIDAFDVAFFVRLVVGEPRGWCDRIDRYHGGGEGLMVYDFDTLLEIRDLLDNDDSAIKNYFKTICDSDDSYKMECPCFIQTKADLQSFFSWLRLDQLQLPFSQNALLSNIQLRDRYSDIYVRYMIDDMRYIFSFYPWMISTDKESIEGIRDNGIAQWSIEYLATVGDVDIYTHHIARHFDIPNFSELPEDPRVIFILDINGRHVEVSVSIECSNPETCEKGDDFGSGHSCRGEWVDRQAAIDGILQFEFKKLF